MPETMWNSNRRLESGSISLRMSLKQNLSPELFIHCCISQQIFSSQGPLECHTQFSRTCRRGVPPRQAAHLPLQHLGFCSSWGILRTLKFPHPYHVPLCLEKQTLIPLLIIVPLGLSDGNKISDSHVPQPGRLLRIHSYGFLEAVL